MIHTVTYTSWKWQFGWNSKDVCRWKFRTSKIHTAAVHTIANYFRWSRPNNAFYAKCFQKYHIISVHWKRCKPWTVGPDLQRIL